MTPSTAISADHLLAPWQEGPPRLGGLPPIDRVTAEALEAATLRAIELQRAEVQAIAQAAEPPDFANTIEALEASGRPLRQLKALRGALAVGASQGAMPAVVARLAAATAALDDAIAHDAALFARIEAVWRGAAAPGPGAGLDADQRRVTEVIRERFRRQGAGLGPDAKARLAAIHARLAELSARFQHNLVADGERHAVMVEDEAELDGLPAAHRDAAAGAAAARGRPGAWAIVNQRSAVWGALTHATHRPLREAAWRQWTGRGQHDGEHDNRPIVAEMLALRGEKARLLGAPSYAHWALEGRMQTDPAAVLALLERTWQRVIGPARRQLDEMQALADADAAAAGRAREPIAPWDRVFLGERLRRARFGVDAGEVSAHLPLPAVIEAMFWAAGRLHGLVFVPVPEAPRLDPAVQVFEVRRRGDGADGSDGSDETLGVLVLDLLHRPGKTHGSHQQAWRDAERLRGHGRRVVPISAVHSNLPPPPAGRPVLLPFEYANVLFHEFGHALHMLTSTARHPSLAPQNVSWDVVELPALLNERWLLDRELLARFARHHETGAAMPAALADRLEAALRHDRVFSLNPDFLVPAIVDLKLHLMADGRGAPIDALAVERDTRAALGMPAAWDVIMSPPNSVHSFAGAYAAGVYVYLWADLLAADVAEAFTTAPGGLWDAGIARRWFDELLSAGHRVPAGEAFVRFRGRAPDPGALDRRFGLAEA